MAHNRLDSGLAWAILVVILGLATLAVAGSYHGLATVDHWLNRYQTMIAGAFALVAAAVGFRAVQAQIAASERIEMDRRERDAAAARAVLPLTLAEITQFVQSNYVYLRRYERASQTGQALPKPPEFKSSLVDSLKENVRSNKNISDEIVTLIQEIQFHVARTREITHNRSMLILSIDNAAELHARLTPLFHYARSGLKFPYRQEDHIGNSRRHLESLLTQGSS